MKTTPKPSHREEIALFRLGVIGDLLCRDLARGELTTELAQRAQLRYRPPGATRTRRYHYKTLQRWYSAECRLMRSCPEERRAVLPRRRLDSA